ncbi:hypothetical protein P7C71_g3840, partial [Lecanoromycetidae sp. Uapishka_2]
MWPTPRVPRLQPKSPLLEQFERRTFLHERLDHSARDELARRGIRDYELTVLVRLSVVELDNIIDLPEFYAFPEADAATTIIDLKRQLKMREQDNAKLKRANDTLSATNKELLDRLKDKNDGQVLSEASISGIGEEEPVYADHLKRKSYTPAGQAREHTTPLVPRPTERIRCAFMVASATKTMTPIGDPFQDMDGWAVDLEFDTSRHGTPYLYLSFRINKGKKDRPIGNKQDQWVAFNVVWRPNMMAHFKKSIVFASMLMERTEHALVAGKCPLDTQDKLPKLVAIKFSTIGFEKPDYSPLKRKPWKHLPEDVQHGLNCLVLGEDPEDITIWFCAEPSPQAVGYNWLLPLQRAMGED